MPYNPLDQCIGRASKEKDVDLIDWERGGEICVVATRIHVWYFVDKKARHIGKYRKTRIHKNTSRT